MIGCTRKSRNAPRKTAAAKRVGTGMADESGAEPEESLAGFQAI